MQQPDAEECSSDTVPDGALSAEGKQTARLPGVVSMTDFFFAKNRLQLQYIASEAKKSSLSVKRTPLLTDNSQKSQQKKGGICEKNANPALKKQASGFKPFPLPLGYLFSPANKGALVKAFLQQTMRGAENSPTPSRYTDSK